MKKIGTIYSKAVAKHTAKNEKETKGEKELKSMPTEKKEMKMKKGKMC